MTLGVTFDLDGTLATVDPPWPDIVATALGTDTPGDATETFGNTLRSALNEVRPDSIEHAAAVTVQEHGLERDPVEIADEFRDREVAATVAIPGARALVEHVAEKRPTGIITNGDESLQRRKAAALGMGDCVETVVVSCGVGVRKPHPAIFETAADRLDANRYLHVGDDRTEDIGGALAAGWEAIYVDAKSEPDEPLATIGGLSRLADLL